MPTKLQAKAAIDAAAVSAKSDIDTILPAVAGGIKDGSISFGPTHVNIVLDAGGSLATADSWLTSIKANLTAAGRTFDVEYKIGRRKEDITQERIIRIDTALTSFIITNF